MTQALNLVFYLFHVAVVNGLMDLLHDIIKTKGLLNEGGAGQPHGLEENLPMLYHDYGLHVRVLFLAGLQELLAVGQV